MSKELVIVAWGGAGDMLLCTPTFKALKETWPDRKIIVYYFKAGKFAHRHPLLNNPYIDSMRMMHWATMWRYPRAWYQYLFRGDKVKYYSLDFQRIPLSYLHDKPVATIVPDIFGIKSADRKVQLFLSEKEDRRAQRRLLGYNNVVLMHITSTCSPNHHWTLESWAELVKQLPEYTFIQLGFKKEPYVEGAVDWRGKTTLREAFCLIKHAASFVGVDGSMSHATNAFDTPGVVLFGDSSPGQWGHPNNINISKHVACSPCYFYLYGKGCPYGNKCMKLITVEEVKQALRSQMEKSRNRTA